MTTQQRPRLAGLTHMIMPNTANIFRALSRRFDVLVLVSGHQDNRYWDPETLGQGLRVERAFGFTIKWNQPGPGGAVWEQRYIHINPGYFVDLVRYRPDAAMSHEMGFRTLAALAYGLIFRVPVWVFSESQRRSDERFSVIRKVLRRYVFAKVVPRWVTSGESATEYLESLGVPSDRIVTAQNPIDETAFSSDLEPYQLDVPPPIALCVSRLTGLKGIDRMLSVASRLQREGHEFSLVIVGDGPESENLKVLANRQGLKRLQWIPQVPLEQMPSVYRAADFLVFPTLADSWGLVVNEALWSGIPVIASRYSGAGPDLLPASNVFDPYDEDDFLDAFRRALTSDIGPADQSRLLTANQVGDMIADDIMQRVSEKK